MYIKRSLQQLKLLANKIRRDVLKISYDAQVGHVGSAFSIVEILIALYFTTLRIRPEKPGWRNRDRFILSKGHAANALYPILAERGFFDKKLLKTYCRNEGLFGEHPETHHLPGIEAATGSLGHGLSLGAGIALAAKKDKASYRSFVLLSDAECDEGEIWEAALFSSQHKLDNLIAIIDYNKVQALGTISEVIELEPLAEKWRKFGWQAVEVDGHNLSQLIDLLNKVPWIPKSPTVFIAHTVRGKGVSFMEHKLEWHYLSPNKEHYKKALKELKS